MARESAAGMTIRSQNDAVAALRSVSHGSHRLKFIAVSEWRPLPGRPSFQPRCDFKFVVILSSFLRNLRNALRTPDICCHHAGAQNHTSRFAFFNHLPFSTTCPWALLSGTLGGRRALQKDGCNWARYRQFAGIIALSRWPPLEWRRASPLNEPMILRSLWLGGHAGSCIRKPEEVAAHACGATKSWG